MADRAAHALFLLSKEHAAVLMSLHHWKHSPLREIGRGVLPELAPAACGLLAGLVRDGPVAQVVRAHA